ncbi:MAG: hypothetical protein R3C44_22605 [Chloroflexota bacterium]
MHYRLRHRHRPHIFGIFIRIAILGLIFGAIFSMVGHLHTECLLARLSRRGIDRHRQWRGRRYPGCPRPCPTAGLATSGAGPRPGAFFLLPLCGLGILLFMGFMFAISRAGRRRGSWGSGRGYGGPWDRGWWDDEDGTTMGRQVEDDEVGPEKIPTITSSRYLLPKEAGQARMRALFPIGLPNAGTVQPVAVH